MKMFTLKKKKKKKKELCRALSEERALNFTVGLDKGDQAFCFCFLRTKLYAIVFWRVRFRTMR